MKWTEDRSENVDDRRGMGSGGALVGGGLGTLIIAAIVFFLGGDPSAILSSGVGSSAPQTEQRQLNSNELQIREFISMLTKENEQTWSKVLSEQGVRFSPAQVVLFEDATNSGCGTAQSAMGDLSIVQQIKKSIWI